MAFLISSVQCSMCYMMFDKIVFEWMKFWETFLIRGINGNDIRFLYICLLWTWNLNLISSKKIVLTRFDTFLDLLDFYDLKRNCKNFKILYLPYRELKYSPWYYMILDLPNNTYLSYLISFSHILFCKVSYISIKSSYWKV